MFGTVQNGLGGLEKAGEWAYTMQRSGRTGRTHSASRWNGKSAWRERSVCQKTPSLVWFGDVDGLVKAIWTSLPEHTGTRVARTLGAKSDGPGAAPRTSMPMATHPARKWGKRKTRSFPYAPGSFNRPVNGSSANHAPMSTCP